MAVREGESGFETEGPNRYYFSEKMPRGDQGALDKKLFSEDMYNKMANMYFEENRSKDEVASIQSFLANIGYLPDDSVDSAFGNMTQGAINRYKKNFEPEMGIIARLMRYMKGV
tara:strand:- start:85 stop:426 length:342 start_codon:yes stop_codon:yes gene_type:complete